MTYTDNDVLDLNQIKQTRQQINVVKIYNIFI